jgi:hypothetical protein
VTTSEELEINCPEGYSVNGGKPIDMLDKTGASMSTTQSLTLPECRRTSLILLTVLPRSVFLRSGVGVCTTK